MSADPTTSTVGAAVAGFLVGGAAGFFLTEGTAAFLHFVLDITPDVEGNPALLVFFLGLPMVTACAGLFVGLRVGRRIRGGRR